MLQNLYQIEILAKWRKFDRKHTFRDFLIFKTRFGIAVFLISSLFITNLTFFCKSAVGLIFRKLRFFRRQT